ncbi:MAG: MFS transporter [Chloroflexi bacterium]|nr:MFS transporter [Chloroflexota bacterium]
MTAVAHLSPPSALAVFHNRAFTLMWTGQLVSTAGSALTSLAASILVFRLTGSALSVGLMLMATAVPTLFVGLIAGVFVDRYDRRRIMLAADLIRAALVCLIPFLIPFHIVWLYVIIALSSAVGQFFDPAHESLLPELASDEELAAANSMIAISSCGSTAIGFAASGLIASRFPIEWAFYADAASFLVSAACIFLIRVPPLRAAEETRVATVFANLRAGARFLFGNPVLRSTFFVALLYVLSIGLWNSLLLPFALRALRATEFEYGLQEGLTSVGFIAGGLLMARLADRLREGQWVVISLVGMAVVGVLYGLSTTVPVAIALVTLSGLLNAPYGVARRLLVQRNTPREMRGRVNSTLFVVRDLVLLVGMAAAGLADVVSVRALMVGASVFLLAPALLALLLPGLGQPAAEWRRAIRLLRGARAAPGLGVGWAATPADFDRLAVQLPALTGLSLRDRQQLAAQSLVADAPAGTVILRRGEKSDAAYFVLDGRAVAGLDEEGGYRLLSVLNPGDFFGEIAALTGLPRTANVVAEQPTTVMQVPPAALRLMMADPQLNRILLSKMTERLLRTDMLDLPRYAEMDQQLLRELRTPEPEPQRSEQAALSA